MQDYSQLERFGVHYCHPTPVRALVRHVGKASSQVSTRLWSIASATAIYLWRKLSTAFHQVEAAISTLVSYIWHGVSAVLGYLWLVYPP